MYVLVDLRACARRTTQVKQGRIAKLQLERLRAPDVTKYASYPIMPGVNYTNVPSMPDHHRALCPVRRGVTQGIRQGLMPYVTMIVEGGIDSSEWDEGDREHTAEVYTI